MTYKFEATNWHNKFYTAGYIPAVGDISRVTSSVTFSNASSESTYETGISPYVTWVSSDKAIAEFLGDGSDRVKFKATGSVTLTVRFANLYSSKVVDVQASSGVPNY